MGQNLPPRPLGLYLHIPFCLRKCDYCSFFSQDYSRAALSRYLEYLDMEIGLYRDFLSEELDTIYFGGGTPSLLSAEEIFMLCSRFKLKENAEITLEINPLQITSSYLKELVSTPVNRLSIGVQSLDNNDLAYLGRRHRAQQIPEKISLLREFGYDNISLDLIYGLPGSSEQSGKENLARFLALGTEHLSCYLLTLDEDTPLGKKQKERATLPEDEILAAQYHAIREGLTDAGFEHYEISNFARSGFRSKHNLLYWNSDPWLALGASAAGWMPPRRYQNAASLKEYYKDIDAGVVFPNTEHSDERQNAADYAMMSLRLIEGMDSAEYKKRFGVDFMKEKCEAVKRLAALDLLEFDENHIRLSSKALFISNTVIGALL
ncbi:MAG: radical SAM family heme chaperone HemW [Candidatus Cloacimonadaceae bacterium]|nr:radical SAM family heme chaperone HemW [Candidatus Cloacimonadaceae bacterium]MDP3114934.1 radical SAM family heme chaperone HemW [Candidatus Cloacimonadaceae bacterium]